MNTERPDDAGAESRSEAGEGASLLDILALPDGERAVAQWLLRRRDASTEEIAAFTGQEETVTRGTLEALSEKGILECSEEEGGKRWRARLARRRGRTGATDLWRVLGE